MRNITTIALAVITCITATSSMATKTQKETYSIDENSLMVPNAEHVYSNSFETPPGTEWSRSDTNSTPNKKHTFLGDFGPETVQLKLQDLPTHRLLHLTFDLYLILTWDGSENWGPDVWSLDMGKDRRLINSTFNNCGFFSSNNTQTFPDWHPSSILYEGWTGATEKQSLGYISIWGKSKRTFTTDSVYHFDLLIPHSDSNLVFNFTSHCEDDKQDQSWGLDNVIIEAIPTPIALPKDGHRPLWQSLGGNDGMAAYRSMRVLVAAENEGVEFIKSHTDLGNGTAEKLLPLIEKLNAPSYADREQATQELIRLARPYHTFIAKMKEELNEPETSLRLTKVLSAITTGNAIAAQHLRQERVLHVMEAIGTAASKSLAEDLTANRRVLNWPVAPE